MSLKLAARLVVLDPAKILDLQENDTTVHVEDLSAFVPPGTLAILMVPDRVSGTGSFKVYHRSHPTTSHALTSEVAGLATIKDQELRWKNSVANDDWDIWLLGYFVQRSTR